MRAGAGSVIQHASRYPHNVQKTSRNLRPTRRHVTILSTNTREQTHSQPTQLPAELVRARQLKTIGTQASAAVLGLGLTAASLQGLETPSLPQWSFTGLACFVSVGAVALGLAVTKDKAQLELHEGRLYIQWGAPSTGPPLAEGAIQVRPTEDGRGNGAFALQHIPAGTYLGNYEGDMLDEVSYWARYPAGVADYCIKVDREWTIDGRDRAQDTSRFSPCHMNHSGVRHNVVRSTKRRDRTVSFFTRKDIQVGEELLLDYGPVYWKSREDQMVD